MSLFSAGAQVAAGAARAEQAKREAAAAEADAQEQAKIRDRDIARFRKRQKVAFLKSGVTIAGSPLAVLEDTRREGLIEVASIRRRGTNVATSKRAAGRLAFTEGLVGATETIQSSLKPF